MCCSLSRMAAACEAEALVASVLTRRLGAEEALHELAFRNALLRSHARELEVTLKRTRRPGADIPAIHELPA
jgi:hypothetical protein